MIRLKTPALTTLTTLTIATLGLAACGGDEGAGPEDTQTRLRATLPQITQASENAMALLDDMPAMAWLESSLDAASVSFASLPIAIPTIGDEPVANLAEAFKAGEEEDTAEALIALIFNADSYEGDGYYRLRGAALCEGLDGAVDAECARSIDDAQIRFRALLAGDGLDISLAIGPERAEPLVLELRSDRMAVLVDLAEGKKAIVHLARISGEEVELPQVMEGVLAFSLVVHGQGDASLELAVREAIRLEAAGADGAVSLAMGARDPMAAMRFNGPQQEVNLILDVGKIDLSAPWTMVDGTSNLAAGTFNLAFGGMSAATTLRADDQSLAITNIGLGDGTTTARLDDHTLFAMDLNAEQGRRFALTITPSAGGTASFELDPGFDLSLAYDLRPLAAAGDFVEDFLLEETYRISLSGQNPAVEPFAPDATGDGGVRVTSGTLTIASTAAAGDVVVNAGQCLIENPTPDAGAHPLLGHLGVADCQ